MPKTCPKYAQIVAQDANYAVYAQRNAGIFRMALDLGCALDDGAGLGAPDHRAAADWYRRAADAGVGQAAYNLSHMYALGRGRAGHWQMMPACLVFFAHVSPSFLVFHGIT